jgi:hypothetical protein
VIDFHAGVAIHGLAVEEPAAVVGDDSDSLIDLSGALALQSEFVFFGRGASYARSYPGDEMVWSLWGSAKLNDLSEGTFYDACSRLVQREIWAALVCGRLTNFGESRSTNR